jgi:hypothetical protein
VFDADVGSMDYGGEFNFVATYPITERLGLGLKYANFNRDAAAPVNFQDTEKVMAWVGKQKHFRTLDVSYNKLLESPESEIEKVNQFLGGELDTTAMLAKIDPKLYRQRKD